LQLLISSSSKENKLIKAARLIIMWTISYPIFGARISLGKLLIPFSLPSL